METRGRVEAFVKSGDKTDNNGRTPAMVAASAGPEVLKAFADYGGKISNQEDRFSRTAADYARDRESRGDAPGLSEVFQEVVKRQGGLISVMPKDEDEAARLGAEAINMFVKAGGQLTDRLTPET